MVTAAAATFLEWSKNKMKLIHFQRVLNDFSSENSDICKKSQIFSIWKTTCLSTCWQQIRIMLSLLKFIEAYWTWHNIFIARKNSRYQIITYLLAFFMKNWFLVKLILLKKHLIIHEKIPDYDCESSLIINWWILWRQTLHQYLAVRDSS